MVQPRHPDMPTHIQSGSPIVCQGEVGFRSVFRVFKRSIINTGRQNAEKLKYWNARILECWGVEIWECRYM